MTNAKRTYYVTVAYTQPFHQYLEIEATSPEEASRLALAEIDKDETYDIHWSDNNGSCDPVYVDWIRTDDDGKAYPIPLDAGELKRFVNPAELREILAWAVEMAAEEIDGLEAGLGCEEEINGAVERHRSAYNLGKRLFPGHWFEGDTP